MQPNDLLESLKDIYLPERVDTMWPLAYGWWVVIAIIILCVFILTGLVLLIKYKRKKLTAKIDTFKKHIDLIEQVNPREISQAVNVYLKSIAIDKFGVDTVKILHGESWLEFLDSKLNAKANVSFKNTSLVNCYKLQELAPAEKEQLLTICEKWLRAVLC